MAKKVGPTDISVLLYGETGTGKEIIAKIIHEHSPRKKQEIVCVNCAALPVELADTELYGNLSGAFTGAHEARLGLVGHANGSTLFLDELSEMPLGLQSKLLRFMQDRRVRRVGAVVEKRINTRIIAAVNSDPLDCIAEKRLRPDLYYRFAITISIAPLRDRKDDILPMAKAYLDFYCAQLSRPAPVFAQEVEKTMLAYHWPGNVRQLCNEMQRCAVFCNGKVNLSDLNLQALKPSTNGEQAAPLTPPRNECAIPATEHAPSPASVPRAPRDAEQSAAPPASRSVGFQPGEFLD